jgi:hypothetical protein
MKYTLQNSEEIVQKYEKNAQNWGKSRFLPVLMKTPLI